MAQWWWPGSFYGGNLGNLGVKYSGGRLATDNQVDGGGGTWMVGCHEEKVYDEGGSDGGRTYYPELQQFVNGQAKWKLFGLQWRPPDAFECCTFAANGEVVSIIFCYQGGFKGGCCGGERGYSSGGKICEIDDSLRSITEIFNAGGCFLLVGGFNGGFKGGGFYGGCYSGGTFDGTFTGGGCYSGGTIDGGSGCSLYGGYGESFKGGGCCGGGKGLQICWGWSSHYTGNEGLGGSKFFGYGGGFKGGGGGCKNGEVAVVNGGWSLETHKGFSVVEENGVKCGAKNEGIFVKYWNGNIIAEIIQHGPCPSNYWQWQGNSHALLVRNAMSLIPSNYIHNFVPTYLYHKPFYSKVTPLLPIEFYIFIHTNTCTLFLTHEHDPLSTIFEHFHNITPLFLILHSGQPNFLHTIFQTLNPHLIKTHTSSLVLTQHIKSSIPISIFMVKSDYSLATTVNAAARTTIPLPPIGINDIKMECIAIYEIAQVSSSICDTIIVTQKYIFVCYTLEKSKATVHFSILMVYPIGQFDGESSSMTPMYTHEAGLIEGLQLGKKIDIHLLRQANTLNWWFGPVQDNTLLLNGFIVPILVPTEADYYPP